LIEGYIGDVKIGSGFGNCKGNYKSSFPFAEERIVYPLFYYIYKNYLILLTCCAIKKPKHI